jgi:hypothetical protein
MNKLYVNYDPRFEAHLCVCSDEIVYKTIYNFLKTKFTSDEDDGNTYDFHEKYKGFVTWENTHKSYGSCYTKEDFLSDMNFLSFEIVNVDKEIFGRFEKLIQYIQENNL